MCDVAYTIHVDRLERRVATEQLAALLAAATGAEGVTMPDPAEARAQFDEQLAAEPAVIDREQADLREALGIPT